MLIELLNAVVDCGGLSTPVNGSMSLNSTTYGSTANFTCDRGYNITGEGTLTCQVDGTWSDSEPTCTLIGKAMLQ